MREEKRDIVIIEQNVYTEYIAASISQGTFLPLPKG
jgi:hypothetical protein